MKITDLKVGEELPSRAHTATSISLFLYNAAIWNAHRIHYDETYAKEEEGHPGVVIDGPLQGDWLSQAAINWVADHGYLVEFEYNNRQASYLGETLYSGGRITGISVEDGLVKLELFIRNEHGDVVTPGSATVSFNS